MYVSMFQYVHFHKSIEASICYWTVNNTSSANRDNGMNISIRNEP